MDFFRRGQRNAVVNGDSVDTPVDETIRENVKTRLAGSIKDLQVEYGEGNPAIAIETNELTHGLVTASGKGLGPSTYSIITFSVIFDTPLLHIINHHHFDNPYPLHIINHIHFKMTPPLYSLAFEAY